MSIIQLVDDRSHEPLQFEYVHGCGGIVTRGRYRTRGLEEEVGEIK